MIISILAFILMLGLVIFVHELGHFLMAKRANILCHEFALGMGPIVFGKKKGETLYSVRAIPIGGFVSMAGEEVSSELVKVNQEIKVLFDTHEDDPNAKITHIILNPDEDRYDQAVRLYVNAVDLQGKDDGVLMINNYEVVRDAHYVMRQKKTQIAPYDRSFESKTILQRFLTIFAGPFMNFVLAFILFVLVAFLIGLPNTETAEIGSVDERMPAHGVFEVGDVIVSIEGNLVETWADIGTNMREQAGNRSIDIEVLREGVIVPLIVSPVISFIGIGFSSDREFVDELIITNIANRTPAGQAGLEEGDIILAIDGIAVTNWSEVIDRVRANPEGEDMLFKVERDGMEMTYTLSPLSERVLEGQGVPMIQNQIGIGPLHERAFFGSILYGFAGLFGTIMMIFNTLGALIAGLVGFTDFGGPVAIYQITSQVVQTGGFVAFLSWTAMLSVNLGIINLLPIPALDGGRLVFLGYEAVFRRPVNKKVENYLHFVMFVLLIGLLIFITFNDIIQSW